MWLPSLALAAYLIPITARAVRQTAHETVREHFIEAATARGLPSRTVTLRHVLPNSVLPVITLLGFNMGALIGGAVVIEAVFALPVWAPTWSTPSPPATTRWFRGSRF